MGGKSVKRLVIDFLELFFIALGVIGCVVIFLAEPIEVIGSSMEPTISSKEQIIAEKISKHYGELKTGDVVVFENVKDNNRLLVKRIIAVPGDEIYLQNGHVFLNGDQLQEDYLLL